MKPNLVLLNVGTNDCSFNIDLPGAGARMQSLVQSVFDAVPGVVVIMSTLIPSPGIKDCAKELSDQFRQLVPKIQNGRLGLADFNAAMDPATMFSDDPIHPNDFGYEFMASVLWKAIWETSSALQAPLDNGQDDSQPISTCAKQAGVSRGPIITQQGSGHDDGTYVHKSIGKGVLVDCRIQKPTAQSESAAIPTHIFFAQLTNINAVDRSAALDDWVSCLCPLCSRPMLVMLTNCNRFAFTIGPPRMVRTSTGSVRISAMAILPPRLCWMFSKIAMEDRVSCLPRRLHSLVFALPLI